RRRSSWSPTTRASRSGPTASSGCSTAGRSSEAPMLRNYLKVAVKVLLRRKFFTFISLFGIAFTLTVLILATALLDHLFSPAPPERWMDRTLYVTRIEMSGEHTHIRTSPGFGFLDASVRNLPGAERVTIFSRGTDVVSYSGGRKLRLSLK